VDVAAGGHTKSVSDIGARCHRHPDHKHECVTFPYLVHQLLVV
jgi:hypothetical protein